MITTPKYCVFPIWNISSFGNLLCKLGVRVHVHELVVYVHVHVHEHEHLHVHGHRCLHV